MEAVVTDTSVASLLDEALDYLKELERTNA